MTTRTMWIVGLAATAIAVGGIASLTANSARAADDSELPWQTDPSGGAPEKTLLDNAVLRVTLISYPAGFHRQGGERRPFDTLLAYVDDGHFKIVRPPNAQPNPNPQRNARRRGGEGGSDHPAGSVVFHPKGNVTPSIEVTQAYRVLYIEVKK